MSLTIIIIYNFQAACRNRLISTTAPVMRERYINQAQLLGRVGSEMKFKEYEDGKTRCFFNVGTDETYTNQNPDGTGLCLSFIYIDAPAGFNLLKCILYSG